MTKIFMLIFAIIIFSGCTKTNFKPPEICNNSDSLILKHIDNPVALSNVFIKVDLVAIDKIPGYDRKDAIKVLDEVESFINDIGGTTYAHLIEYLLAKFRLANASAGAIVFTLSSQIQVLNSSMPITDCDLAMIKIHIQKHREELMK